jgi:AcrR family transcriptional regulator
VEVSRNRAALVAAAIRVLAARPDAGMAEIAGAAGVTRQTAYAHFGTRDALLAAVRDELSRRAFAVLEDADLDAGTATQALDRFLTAVGTLLAEQSAAPGGPESDPAAEEARHVPVQERLASLVERGRASGEFTTPLATGWLVEATIALGHSAGRRLRAGLVDAGTAADEFRTAVLLLYGVIAGAPTSRARRAR